MGSRAGRRRSRRLGSRFTSLIFPIVALAVRMACARVCFGCVASGHGHGGGGQYKYDGGGVTVVGKGSEWW